MKRKPLVIKVSKKDIEEMKKALTRAYDPIEYDQSYWSQTDDIIVEYLTLMCWYLELFDEHFSVITGLK